jgi:hypothetical protein
MYMLLISRAGCSTSVEVSYYLLMFVFPIGFSTFFDRKLLYQGIQYVFPRASGLLSQLYLYLSSLAVTQDGQSRIIWVAVTREQYLR